MDTKLDITKSEQHKKILEELVKLTKYEAAAKKVTLGDIDCISYIELVQTEKKGLVGELTQNILNYFNAQKYITEYKNATKMGNCIQNNIYATNKDTKHKVAIAQTAGTDYLILICTQ